MTPDGETSGSETSENYGEPTLVGAYEHWDGMNAEDLRTVMKSAFAVLYDQLMPREGSAEIGSTDTDPTGSASTLVG